MNIASNGILIAIIAHGLVGLTLVWDKVLLKQTKGQSVVNYVFWLGAISIFGCIVGVFGMHMPSLFMLGIALAGGAADMLGSWAYYMALKGGEATQTLAIMGGFAPLATALMASPLLNEHLKGASMWGFGILVAGGFMMFSSQKINIKKILPLVLLAAACLGLSNVLQRAVFENMGFSTGFVFFCIGEFLFSMLFLVYGPWRQQIFKQSEEAQPRSKVGYFANRFFNGLGVFLVSFAVSRATPSLVSAISGVRYAAIFVTVLLLTKFKPEWLKETFEGWTLWAKVIATALVIAGLVVVGLGGNGSNSSAGAELFRPAYDNLRGISLPDTATILAGLHLNRGGRGGR